MNGKKICALTFDDGPSDTTLMILDLLKYYGCTASFFVIGNRIYTDEHKIIMQKATEQGCTVENHSYTHGSLRNMTKEAVFEEYEKTQKIIYDVVGDYPRFFRAPGLGADDSVFETVPLTFAGGSCGSADWNSHPDDKQTSGLELRIKGLFETAKDGHIFLMHDCARNYLTPAALSVVLPKLIDDGFEFVNMRRLFELKGQALTPKAKIQWSDVGN